MPTPAALTAEKREAILDSARDAFAEHGYEGASMSAITQAAGVSKSTVYHHYRSKAELFGAFVERECARMLAQHFGDARMPRGDTGQTLRAIGIGMVELITSPVCLMIDRVVTSRGRGLPGTGGGVLRGGAAAGDHPTGWLAESADGGRRLGGAGRGVRGRSVLHACADQHLLSVPVAPWPTLT